MIRVHPILGIFFFLAALTGCMGGEDETNELPLGAGTYQHEESITFTEAEFGFDGTGEQMAQITLNSDKTYLVQGYLTVDGRDDIQELPFIEEKGSFSQSNGSVVLTERLTRDYSLSRKSWGAWGIPDDGNTDTFKIRNVTSSTFQEYSDDLKSWLTWSKI